MALAFYRLPLLYLIEEFPRVSRKPEGMVLAGEGLRWCKAAFSSPSVPGRKRSQQRRVENVERGTCSERPSHVQGAIGSVSFVCHF